MNSIVLWVWHALVLDTNLTGCFLNALSSSQNLTLLNIALFAKFPGYLPSWQLLMSAEVSERKFPQWILRSLCFTRYHSWLVAALSSFRCWLSRCCTLCPHRLYHNIIFYVGAIVAAEKSSSFFFGAWHSTCTAANIVRFFRVSSDLPKPRWFLLNSDRSAAAIMLRVLARPFHCGSFSNELFRSARGNGRVKPLTVFPLSSSAPPALISQYTLSTGWLPQKWPSL